MNQSAPEFDFSTIVNNAKDAVIVTKAEPIDDPGPEIIYVNKAFTEMTGYSSEEVIGKSPRILQSKDTEQKEKLAIRRALKRRKQFELLCVITLKRAGNIGLISASLLCMTRMENSHTLPPFKETSQNKKNLERELQILCRTDPLTTAANRRAFEEMLSQEFSRFKRSRKEYALIMIDIDHFKSVNDEYGHSVGDKVLIEVTEKCKDSLRYHDIVARLGGEEFCILLPYTNAMQAKQIAERLRGKIESMQIISEGNRINVTVSVGLSLVCLTILTVTMPCNGRIKTLRGKRSGS